MRFVLHFFLFKMFIHRRRCRCHRCRLFRREHQIPNMKYYILLCRSCFVCVSRLLTVITRSIFDFVCLAQLFSRFSYAWCRFSQPRSHAAWAPLHMPLRDRVALSRVYISTMNGIRTLTTATHDDKSCSVVIGLVAPHTCQPCSNVHSYLNSRLCSVPATNGTMFVIFWAQIHACVRVCVWVSVCVQFWSGFVPQARFE